MLMCQYFEQGEWGTCFSDNGAHAHKWAFSIVQSFKNVWGAPVRGKARGSNVKKVQSTWIQKDIDRFKV